MTKHLLFRPGLIRSALVIGLATGLAACGLMPPTQQQPFTVAGSTPVPAATAKPFQNSDPKIDAVLAKQVCVDNYQKQAAKTLPADDGSFEQWQVQCTPYHPTLVAGIPLPSIW
ncbi:MAG TPA: hypothetical protein VL574_02455 [Stellaceae bacterium]|nr:hypothetical protein [Stellaceae bacterium]